MTIRGLVASLGWRFDTACFAGMTEGNEQGAMNQPGVTRGTNVLHNRARFNMLLCASGGPPGKPGRPLAR